MISYEICIEILGFTAQQRIRNMLLTSGAKHSPPSFLFGGPYGQFRRFRNFIWPRHSFSTFWGIKELKLKHFRFSQTSLHVNGGPGIIVSLSSLEISQNHWGKVCSKISKIEISRNLKFSIETMISYEIYIEFLRFSAQQRIRNRPPRHELREFLMLLLRIRSV